MTKKKVNWTITLPQIVVLNRLINGKILRTILLLALDLRSYFIWYKKNTYLLPMYSFIPLFSSILQQMHWVKYARIWVCSGPYFPVKGQNRRLYGKMRVGQNRNSGVFYAMIFYQTILNTLRKKQKFHLISWCGIFVKRYNFCRVSGESPKTMRKLCLSAKFHTKKLGEITVFYAVILNKCWVYNIKIEYWIDTWLEYLSTLK